MICSYLVCPRINSSCNIELVPVWAGIIRRMTVDIPSRHGNGTTLCRFVVPGNVCLYPCFDTDKRTYITSSCFSGCLPQPHIGTVNGCTFLNLIRHQKLHEGTPCSKSCRMSKTTKWFFPIWVIRFSGIRSCILVITKITGCRVDDNRIYST